MKRPTVSEATIQEIQDAFKSARYQQKEAECWLCGAIFTRTRVDRRFCSPEHRKLFWRMKKRLNSEDE